MEKYVGFDVLESMVVKAREVYREAPQCIFTSSVERAGTQSIMRLPPEFST